MPTLLVRVALFAVLIVLAACGPSTASPGASESEPVASSGTSQDPAASTPAAPSAAPSQGGSATDLSGGDPMADVWIHGGAGVIRIDAATGEEVGQRAYEDWGCRWDRLGGVGPAEVWILGVGIADLPEGGFFPPPPSDNPLSGGCVARLPLDGGAAEVTTFDVPESQYASFWDGIVMDGELWFAAAHVSTQGGSLGPGNSDLYRVAPRGEVEQVASGIVDVAAAAGTVYVIGDPDGDGFHAAATLDPASGSTTPFEIPGIAVGGVTNVTANGDLAIFSLTTHEPFERGLVVIDASGVIIGSVFEPAVDGSLFPYRGFWATPDGIFALSDGVLSVPMQPRAAPQILDPCSPFGTPEDPPECRYDAMYGVSDGVWVIHTIQNATPQVSTLRRYSAAEPRTAEVPLPTIEP